MSFTADQLSSLNRINDLLADLEPRIFEKVKQFHVLEARGKTVNCMPAVDVSASCVVVKIAYYSSVNDTGPFYTLTTSFPQRIPPDFVWDSIAHLQQHNWPVLNNPCSYLMHNLLQQSCQKLNDIINLSLIGVQIDVSDYPNIVASLHSSPDSVAWNGTRGIA